MNEAERHYFPVEGNNYLPAHAEIGGAPDLGCALRMGIHDDAIDVEYWQQPDGTWAAVCMLTRSGVGVSVGAISEERIFNYVAAAMERFWEYLARQEALTPQLRLIRRFERHPLRFRRVSCPTVGIGN